MTRILEEISKKNYKSLLFNFWFLNISGWIIYSIIFLPFAYKYYGSETYKIVLAFCHVLFGFLITVFLRLIYKKFDLNKFNIIKIAIWVVFLSFLSTMLWERLNDAARIMFIGWEKGFKHNTLFGMLYEVIWSTPIFLAWSLFYFAINIFRKFEEERENSIKTQTLFVETQLEMLRYQLNPHFIFNAMSSLRALVQIDQSKAKEMITKLAEFLRYALIGDNRNEVPLSKELEITKSYIDIEKVRFGDNLNVQIEADDLALEYPFPSFLLQPLIDNAIKHGITNNNQKLEINISANIIDNKTLQVSVANNGTLKKPGENSDKDSTKTGITNIRKRLQFLYPGHNSFSLEEKDGKVKAKILIKKSV